MSIRSILVTASLLAMAPGYGELRASQVFTSAWDKFHVESCGIEIWGTQSKSGISSLKIKAFGRKFMLTKSQLSELLGFSANGLRIYNEGGYEGMGGETFYICFFTESEPAKRNSKMITLSQEYGVIIESGHFE